VRASAQRICRLLSYSLFSGKAPTLDTMLRDFVGSQELIRCHAVDGRTMNPIRRWRCVL